MSCTTGSLFHCESGVGDTMSITKKTIRYFSVLILLLFALLGNLWLIFENEHSLIDVQKRRYESRLVAEELRRSSDDLTRMARTYVVTGDPRFLEYYKEISAIRDGKSPRPVKYENVYWDFISGQKDYQGKLGEKMSINDQMKALHFSESELDLLERAKRFSDDLMKLEIQAFNALQGLYQGDEETYNEKGKPDPVLAQKMVFGETYYYAKYRIMEKINQFYELLDSRTENEVRRVAILQKIYLSIALMLSVIIIGMVAFGFWLIQKDVIKPLNNMSEWIKQMHNGKYTFDAREFRNDEIGLLAHTFANMASQVSDNICNLEHMSQTDHLTQINNRIALDKALHNEMNRFERYGIPCSILILDIDHFKKVNDQYGHLVGDKVLMEISQILVNTTRKTDIPGRWGGEEFLLICPGTDLTGGRILAELLRERISHHEFEGPGHITVSIGVSAFEEGKSVGETIKEADDLLYKAKSEGRNRVC